MDAPNVHTIGPTGRPERQGLRNSLLSVSFVGGGQVRAWLDSLFRLFQYSVMARARVVVMVAPLVGPLVV